ncbi:MAG: hypothetical protein AB3N14_10005 [Flavobacteriaceae bacterium]
MKTKNYEGGIHNLPANEIYLNISHLEKGKYVLKIMHKNKVLLSTHFTKD